MILYIYILNKWITFKLGYKSRESFRRKKNIYWTWIESYSWDPGKPINCQGDCWFSTAGSSILGSSPEVGHFEGLRPNIIPFLSSSVCLRWWWWHLDKGAFGCLFIVSHAEGHLVHLRWSNLNFLPLQRCYRRAQVYLGEWKVGFPFLAQGTVKQVWINHYDLGVNMCFAHTCLEMCTVHLVFSLLYTHCTSQKFKVFPKPLINSWGIAHIWS